MPFNQQIVENNIDHICRHIGFHGDFRIASPSLRGIHRQGNYRKYNESHDNSEILYRFRVGRFLRTAHADYRIRKYHTGQTDNHRHNQYKKTGRTQNFIGSFLIFLPLTPCDQRRDGYIHRDKNSQSDKFRLRSQAYRRHGMGSHPADHQGIHHSHQGYKK